MSEQTPRYDPQTGKPLYPQDNGMKPGVVALIAVLAAAIGLGIGALVFNDDSTPTTDTVITEPGRTEITVKSTPAQTITETETITVTTTTPDDSGGATP